MNKKNFVTIALLISSALILSACSKSDDNQIKSTLSKMQKESSSVNKEVDTHIKRSDVYEAKDGDKEVAIEEFKLTLISAEDKGKKIESKQGEANGHYIEVVARIHETRAGEEEYVRDDITILNFQVVDDKGNTYNALYYQGSGTNPAMGLKNLQVGEAYNFTLFFDIPNDAKNLKLKFSTTIPGGFDKNGDKIEITDAGLVGMGM